MDHIKIEDASNDAIKHVLKIFSKLEPFFPKNSNITSVSDILADELEFNGYSKSEVLSFIYQTTKNLISVHLSDISKKISTHPENKGGTKSNFANERKFINSLHSPATMMREDNFLWFEDQQILLDKDQFIDNSLFFKVENDLVNLFKKELALFNNHAVFDTLIFQIDDSIHDTFFIKQEGLKFIEEKNILNNKSDISDKYIANIFKALDVFDFNDNEKINTLCTFETFFKDRYLKSNRDQLLNVISEKKADLLSLPNLLVKYHENSSNHSVDMFNWERFFSYADKDQLNSALDILLTTQNAKDDLIFMSKSDDYDIFVQLKERDSILGQAFKHLSEIKDQHNQNHVLSTIDFIERKINQKVEEMESPDIAEEKQRNKNTSGSLKLF